MSSIGDTSWYSTVLLLHSRWEKFLQCRIKSMRSCVYYRTEKKRKQSRLFSLQTIHIDEFDGYLFSSDNFFLCVLLTHPRRSIHRRVPHSYQQVARCSPGIVTFHSDLCLSLCLFICSDHPTNEEKTPSLDPSGKVPQPAFLRSFEAELNKVDEYFQSNASDVRQAVLDSLQRMYNQNEWHDNPLTIICRDLDIHVRNVTVQRSLAEVIAFRYRRPNNCWSWKRHVTPWKLNTMLCISQWTIDFQCLSIYSLVTSNLPRNHLFLLVENERRAEMR